MVAPVAVVEEQHPIVRNFCKFSNPWKMTLGLIAAKYQKANQDQIVRSFDDEIITYHETFKSLSPQRSHYCFTTQEIIFTCLVAVDVQFGWCLGCPSPSWLGPKLSYLGRLLAIWASPVRLFLRTACQPMKQNRPSSQDICSVHVPAMLSTIQGAMRSYRILNMHLSHPALGLIWRYFCFCLVIDNRNNRQYK